MASAAAAAHTPTPPRRARVLVGSRNPVKVAAARGGLEKALGRGEGDADGLPRAEASVEAVGVDAPSGVSEQPVGDAETLRGCLNRLAHARAVARSDEDASGAPAYDFVAAVEGGVCTREGRDAALGGDAGDKALCCFAWAALLDVRTGRVGKARSAEFELPREMSRLVLEEGLELGDAHDVVMGTVGSKRRGGTVGALTDGLITRAGYYEHAFVLAAMPFFEGTGALFDGALADGG